MAEDNNKEATRGWSRIFSIFGVAKETPTKLQPAPSQDPGASTPSGAFSEQELNYLPGFATKDLSSGKVKDIEKYFSHTSENIAKTTRELQRFKVLTPEIGKAKMVLIPTIMSPNDVQTDSITIVVDTDELEPEVVTKLNEDLTEYFNDGLKLSTNVAEWIGEALFESGAKPVLILPKGPITLLSDAMDLEDKLVNQGSNLELGLEGISFEVAKPDINNVEISEENLFGVTEEINDETYDIDVTNAIYSHFDDVLIANELNTDKNKKNIKPSVEALAKSAKKNTKGIKDAASGLFTFTTDYRSVVSAKETSDIKVKALSKRITESIYGTDSGRMFICSDEEGLSDGDHPTLMPLPSEAVIPVSVPGDPSSHIGYFILTDGMGNPLDMTGNGEHAGPYNSESMTKSTCGGNSFANMERGTQIIYGGQMTADGLSKNQQFEAASTVFGITVKKMLENKLRDNGLDGLTIHQHQAISTTLFQRLIRKAKVRILFVPATMLAYYAFDYRSDGTGKSILEDSSFLISLRNTLVIANVLTAIKNSTDRTKIEFNVGDQATNVEQLLDTVKKMFVSKRMLNFEHDPLTVARDLIQNSVSIIPKGLRGLEDLDVTIDESSNQSTQPDTDMMDKISELLTLSMNIPPSALNRLSEDEYSRSIATTNLFFANDIRMKQQIVINITSQLIRQYILSSKSLMTMMLDAMKVTNKPSDTQIDESGETVTSDNLNKQNGQKIEKVESLLYKIINSTSISLPTPNIAATKAQYEELREAIDAVDSLVNKLFDEETIGIDDNATKEAYNAMKGFVRQEVLRRIASELGPHGAINIPTINNIDPEEVAGYNQVVINFKRHLEHMKAHLDKSGEEGGGGSRW